MMVICKKAIDPTPPEPRCPWCGSAAVEPYVTRRENGTLDLHGACKLGHAWTANLLIPEAS